MKHKQNLTFKQRLNKNFINALGWRTNHKYVVFESDDWGSIRMPNKEFYNYLLSKGCPVDKVYFDKYDALEDSADLANLFEVLSSVKDKNDHPAVFTPLCVVANPDFKKIESSRFSEYYFETTLQTYLQYPGAENTQSTALQGIKNKIWVPQFHAREHIQSNRYLKALQSGKEVEMECFRNHAVLGFVNSDIDYFPAFAIDSRNDINDRSKNIKEGIVLFNEMYGYVPISFCPPCGIINTELFDTFSEEGVWGLQAGQYFSPEGNGTIKHFQYKWGHKNKNGQIFSRRNCTFEPARDHNIDWADRCMKEIELAFRWGKPACINTHRVSYIGRIFKENRDDSLKQLEVLLKMIVKRWPDVEFISSDILFNIVKENKL